MAGRRDADRPLCEPCAEEPIDSVVDDKLAAVSASRASSPAAAAAAAAPGEDVAAPAVPATGAPDNTAEARGVVRGTVRSVTNRNFSCSWS